MKKAITFLLILCSSTAFAKVHIVITPQRSESQIQEAANSVTVIDQETIEKSQKRTVGEILQNEPGTYAITSGGLGKQTSVFLRGSKSEHVLVLIDGVEMNDPSSPTRGFDFANLSLEHIERIEIVRGTQSVLYGSDAIGGVIQIFTKKAAKENSTQNTFSASLGSFSTLDLAFDGSLTHNKLNLRMGLQRLKTDGISSFDEDLAPNTDKDGYELYTLSSKVGYQFNDETSLNIWGRYQISESQLDGFDPVAFTFSDQRDYESSEKDLYAGASFTTKIKDLYKPTLTLGYTQVDRTLDEFDFSDNQYKPSGNYDGDQIKAALVHAFYLHKNHTVILGNEAEKEIFKSTSTFGNFNKQSAYHIGNFAQYNLDTDTFDLSLGGRVEHHENFGTQHFVQASPSIQVPGGGPLVSMNIATGFKAPSLFQLFDAFSGNANLAPEEVTSIDFGILQRFQDQAYVGLTYFQNDFDQTIDFDFATFAYTNIGQSKSEGVEIQGGAKIAKLIDIDTQWTFQDAKDASGNALLRRPGRKGKVTLGYAPKGKPYSAGVNFAFVGNRQDIARKLSSYTLWGLQGAWRIKEGLTWQAAVNNLFDKDYQEIDQYGTPGINWTTSLRYSI